MSFSPRCAFLSVLAGLLLAGAAVAQPERPTAMQLFPAETVLWIRTPDAGLFTERYRASSIGQMLRDPEFADLRERTGVAISDAYSNYARDLLEADLEDLLKLPQGEIAFGVIHRPGSGPGLLLIADFGEQVQVAQQVVERLQGLASGGGASVTTEQLRSDEATVIRDGNKQDRAFAIVRRESVFVVCNDSNLLQCVLDHWDGIPIEAAADEDNSDSDGESGDEDSKADKDSEPPLYAQPLADNPSFSATLRELTPGGEEPPQALFYVDPIGMVEAVGGRSTGVRIAMATFPALGVDGIKAFGGAMWIATDTWDSLVRGHLLLSNPRAGVVKVARLETGETAPPAFVPTAVENFISARIDASRLFDDIASLYDRFQYEGAFRKLVAENLSENLGVEFEEEFVDILDGSAMYITGYDETGQIFGAQTCIAFGVKDKAAAEAALDKVIAKYPNLFGEQSFGSVKYYDLGPPQARERPPSEQAKQPLPVLGFLGDTLVFNQSNQFFQQMIEAHEGVRPRLNDSLQYRLVRSRLDRLTRGEPFSMMGYHDAEPVFRHFHQLATSEETSEQLAGINEAVPFFRSIRDIVSGAEIPRIETILKYTAPSGSVMIDTPTGWHMISFAYRPASSD